MVSDLITALGEMSDISSLEQDYLVFVDGGEML